MEFWNQKSFCMVTGASRGIGQTIAIEFSKNMAPGSVLLLVARTIGGLESTKSSIEGLGNNCTVVISQLDLSTPNKCEYLNTIQNSLKTVGKTPGDFEHCILVHNAASLGIDKGWKVEEIEDIDYIQKFYSFNLFSPIVLTSQFFKTFADPSKQRSVIQISSDGVIEPFNTWGLYCASKAARDTLMKSLSLESGIQTINWAPGCVQTAIYDEAIKDTGDKELAKFFLESKEAGNILTCEQTVLKLIKVLAMKKYIKGEHVCYHEIE